MIVLQELGMFMSCLSVVGTNGNDIERSCKSSILEFKWVTCTVYRVRMIIMLSGLGYWGLWRPWCSLLSCWLAPQLRDSGWGLSSSRNSIMILLIRPPRYISNCNLNLYRFFGCLLTLENDCLLLRSTPPSWPYRQSWVVWGMWCITIPGSPVWVASWPTLLSSPSLSSSHGQGEAL